jgi:hypothetical protein
MSLRHTRVAYAGCIDGTFEGIPFSKTTHGYGECPVYSLRPNPPALLNRTVPSTRQPLLEMLAEMELRLDDARLYSCPESQEELQKT